MFIADNIIILNQHNSFVYEKSYFKTSAEFFSTLKDKQYIFKADIINSINSTTVDLIAQFIEMSVNVFSNNNLTMIASDSVTHKLLEFK